MSGHPALEQFPDLSPAHFASHPAWVQCHSVDYDAPWYEESDEETFRPWTGPLPVRPDQGIMLVAAEFTLADGTRLLGFVTPAPTDAAHDPRVLAIQQPQMFMPSGRRESFWDGVVARSAGELTRFYAELARPARQVFPIEFTADAGLATGLTSGTISGFYSINSLDGPPRVVQ